MGLPPVMQVFIAVIIISAIVGAVAQMLSKMSQQNNNANRRPLVDGERDRPERTERAERGAIRQSTSDVDRFLAEIDRLRQRQELPPATPARSGNGNGGSRRPRPMAEPVRPPRRAEAVPEVSSAYDQPPRPILSGSRVDELPQISQLPQASLLPLASPPPLPAVSPPLPRISTAPIISTATTPVTPTTPITPVTPRALPRRPRPTPTTDFAAQLTQLLGTKNGLPLAVVLAEVLGKPKSRPM